MTLAVVIEIFADVDCNSRLLGVLLLSEYGFCCKGLRMISNRLIILIIPGFVLFDAHCFARLSRLGGFTNYH